MTEHNYDNEELARLQGKTILVTGCSTGIGYATATVAYKHGANVILADWNEQGLKGLVEILEGDSGQGKGRLISRKTNVANWNDMIATFDLGFERFKCIDAVISNAGVDAEEMLLNHQVDPTTKQLKAPSLRGLNINLIGHIYAVHCATYYFKKCKGSLAQIVLTSSAAAFLDSPPLHMYSTAKSGVVGMLRSLRTDLVKQGVTINVVAPWMTVTPMLPKSFEALWTGLPCNSSEGVGRALLYPIIRTDVNGKCFFIAGNKIIDLEDTLASSRPIWMGKELDKLVKEGQTRILEHRPFGQP